MLLIFENFNEINSICEKYGIKNYTINSDGSINVDEDLNLSYRNLIKLPLKFNIVSGYFYCYRNELTSLEGCPKEVGGNFNCYDNQLTSLEGGPEKVGGNYYCDNNIIIKPEGFPKEVGVIFDCKYNPISEIYYLFPDYRSFMESLDYSYFKGSNNIDKIRFREALREFGLKLPEKLKNYKYI